MLLGFSMANAKFEQLPKGKTLANRPGITLSADVALGNAANFATINKKGISKRLNVRRKAAEPIFSDDFESGNLDQWTIYTEGESPTADGWTVENNCGGFLAHEGTYFACSKSWTPGTGQGQIYSADNWLVTPLVSLGGKLSFWDRSDPNYPDLYEVLLSTTGNAPSDFTTTLRPMQEANGEWTEVDVDLSAYKGQGYIAIHHVSYDKYHLHIDDFCVYPPEEVFDVASLVGDYIWNYETSDELAADLSSITTTAGQARVKITLSEKTEGGITISGMFPYDLEATVESGYDGYYIVIESGQLAGTSSLGDYVIDGLFYFEGEEEVEAGWYYTFIFGDIADDGSIHFDNWICRILTGGEYDGYSLTPYYVAGSTLTPTEPLTVVTLPDGLEIRPYMMSYDEGNKSINVAVDGNDVYFQGMSKYIPEAWVKGTKEGNFVTFPSMQYMGEYESYGSSYFFYNGEAVFTYDPEAGTYTAEGLVYGVLDDRYYDGYYTNPMLALVVEKAVIPANPEITSMLESSSYGWYITFNVPLLDVNGEPLIGSKLSYMIYTDIEGEVAPLTFTPATHTKLTQDMTEIPFGFSEDWDFYDNKIYLNELYSEEWNKIGIQSIYRGGGEENVTEIQWLTIKPYANADAIDPDGLTYNFNSGTMQGWTTIDADGDGYNWMITTGGVAPRGGEGYAVYSQSYANTPLTPDNFLVSPKLKLGASMRFYACAQDASYPAEHFAVAVSTAGNTDAADFTNVQEWTLEASPAARAKVNARVMSHGPHKVQGNWYEYTADLSAYRGQEGYVAIRHFNVTDQFYIVVDDISFEEPAFTIVPEEGVVESLQSFEITFSKFEVVAEGATATLTNTTTEASMSGSIELDGNMLTITFEETTEPGDYTLTIEGVKKADTGEDIELSFCYTIEEQPVVVELPDGAEVNTWYLAAYDSDDAIVNREVGVAIVDNDIYVQGLCDYLPEAWVKGTIDAEVGTATFTNGQFYGAYDEKFNLFFVGFDEAMGDDVVCTYDAENGLLITESYIVLASDRKGNEWYDYYYDVEISRDRPDSFPVEAPEGLETETYLFTASCLESGEEEWMEYKYQVQVGFDGNDVYFSGLNSDCDDYWMKGTLSEDGKTVTIPASQYMGGFTIWSWTFDYFITAKDEENNMTDVVLNYDASSSIFSTPQTVVLNGSKFDWDPYQTFTSVEITKMPDLAATPADPILEYCDFTQEQGYNKIYASIPAEDVDGNDLLTSKLFYTIWFEWDGQPQPYTFTAALYSGDFGEDVTEVPYRHDGYDIYEGGEIIYFEDEPEELLSWSKVGIQSIYYGGGERHTSNIVWMDNPDFDPTGIGNLYDGRVLADDVIYNLSGQRLSKAQKGINIARGKKVLVK